MTLTKRPFGRTGQQLTVLGYGSMELRGTPWGPDIEDALAGRLLNAVLDAGINLIDTSIDYGHSEELIGTQIGHRRDEYFLASKCGCPIGDPPPGASPPFPHDYGERNIRAGVEQSLRRLRTDHLDLLQLHTSPSLAELETHRTIDTLSALREEGKVRFIGMSGGLPNLPDHIRMDVFDAFQIPYSAMRLENEDLITAAAATGAGVVIRSGAGRGGAPLARSREKAAAAVDESTRRWESSGVQDRLGEMSRLEFVLRFALSHADASSVLVGTSKIEHLQSNVTVAEKGPLPPDLYAETRGLLRSSNV